jgi:hypothetical protein
MKIVSLFPLIAMLSACATNQSTPVQNAQLSFSQACAGYSAALTAATQADLQNRLSKAAVQVITQTDAQITPICTGPAPTTAATQQALVTQITAATTTLAITALEKTK